MFLFAPGAGAPSTSAWMAAWRERLQTLGDVEVVAEASDGLEALHLAEKHRPDVILLDIGLPDLDGFQVVGQIRSAPGLRGVRVIAVSGYSQPQDLLRAKRAGFDLHVAKPVQPELLRELLEGL